MTFAGRQVDLGPGRRTRWPPGTAPSTSPHAARCSPRELMAGLPPDTLRRPGALWAEGFSLADPAGTPRGPGPGPPERARPPRRRGGPGPRGPRGRWGGPRRAAGRGPVGAPRRAPGPGPRGPRGRRGRRHHLSPVGLLPSSSLEPVAAPPAPVVGRELTTGAGGYEVTFPAPPSAGGGGGVPVPARVQPAGRRPARATRPPPLRRPARGLRRQAAAPVFFDDADIEADPALRRQVVRAGGAGAGSAAEWRATPPPLPGRESPAWRRDVPGSVAAACTMEVMHDAGGAQTLPLPPGPARRTTPAGSATPGRTAAPGSRDGGGARGAGGARRPPHPAVVPAVGRRGQPDPDGRRARRPGPKADDPDFPEVEVRTSTSGGARRPRPTGRATASWWCSRPTCAGPDRAELVEWLVARTMDRRPRAAASDRALAERAAALADRYVDGVRPTLHPLGDQPGEALGLVHGPDRRDPALPPPALGPRGGCSTPPSSTSWPTWCTPTTRRRSTRSPTATPAHARRRCSWRATPWASASHAPRASPAAPASPSTGGHRLGVASPSAARRPATRR